MLSSSIQLYAIDLNNKIQNTDKSDFSTINSPFRTKNKKSSVDLEYSYTTNPLILKRQNGTTTPLIQGLSVLEVSALFGFSDSVQLGILIPGEQPYGVVGPASEAKTYLNNILIEPKIYISDNIAFMPVYYIPGSSKLPIQTSASLNEVNDMPLGKDKGAYGARMSLGFGDKEDTNSVLTAIQVGALMAPDSKFCGTVNCHLSEIDQSSRIQLGGAVSYPVSGTIRLLLEAYGEKTKNNTPLEAIATIQYKEDNFLMRVGGGTGDFNGTTANAAKVLASFTYFFGSEKQTAKNYVPDSAPVRNQNFEDRIKELKRKESETPDLKEDPIEEQNAPTTETEGAQDLLVQNDLIIMPRKVPTYSAKIPKPKKAPITPVEDTRVYLVFDRKRSKEEFSPLDDEDSDDKGRQPASVDLDRNQLVFDRSKNKIKKAIQLIDNNLYLYEKAAANNDKELMKSLETELRWGIRVYNKNINVLNKQNSGEIVLQYNQKVEEAEHILSGEPSGQKVELFLVSEDKSIVRTDDTSTSDNILVRLSEGTEVLVLGSVEYDESVQIKILKGRLANYKYPLFIDKKYLIRKDGVVTIAKAEEAVLLQTKPIFAEPVVAKEVVETQIVVEQPKEEVVVTEVDPELDSEEILADTEAHLAQSLLEEQLDFEYPENEELVLVPVQTPEPTAEIVFATPAAEAKVELEVVEPVVEAVSAEVVKEEPKIVEIPAEAVVPAEPELDFDPEDSEEAIVEAPPVTKPEVVVEAAPVATPVIAAPAAPVVEPVIEPVAAVPVVEEQNIKSSDPLAELVKEDTPVRAPVGTERELVKTLPKKKQGVSKPEVEKPVAEETKVQIVETAPVETKVEIVESKPVTESTPAPAEEVIEVKSAVEAAKPAVVIVEEKKQEVPATKLEVVEEVVEKKPEVQTQQPKVEQPATPVVIIKESDEEKALNDRVDKAAFDAQVKFEQEKQQKEELRQKLEAERLEKLKEEEKKKIDQFLELKAESSKDVKQKETPKEPVKTPSETPVKEVKSEETPAKESLFNELIKKSSETLKEEDAIEEQNGPSFEDF